MAPAFVDYLLTACRDLVCVNHDVVINLLAHLVGASAPTLLTGARLMGESQQPVEEHAVNQHVAGAMEELRPLLTFGPVTTLNPCVSNSGQSGGCT